MKYSKEQVSQSLALLKKWIKPKDVIFTRLDHVSRSGMQREITLIKIEKNNPSYLSYHVARVLGMSLGKRDGIIIGGCGMDMGFELVYRLGQALWPNGTPKPHGTRNGEPDSDGGYALKQRWI